MNTLFAMLGGRKLVLGFIVIAIGVAVDLLKPAGLSSNLLYLLCFISTSFFLANAANSIAYARKAPETEVSPQEVAKDTSSERFDKMEAQLGHTIQGVTTVMETLQYIIKKANLG